MPQTSPAGSSLAILTEVPGTELRQLRATFENFRDFVVRYSPWLSDSCIFVETLEAVPVGAPIRLEIRLRDRPFLIRALGQVDWVRSASDGDEDGPPGAALNITYLDPASAHLIDSIFRLYTGQQSAAMGEEVVETWELDVESLIDQAFPGAPALGRDAAPPDTSPAEGTPPNTPPADTAPAALTPTGTSSTATASPDLVPENTAQPYEVAAESEPQPEAGMPEELEVPIELAELELPDALDEPATSAEITAVAATDEPVDVTTLESSESSATDDEMEWEARLSAAFAEHESVEPEAAQQAAAHQAAPGQTETRAQQEVPPATEGSGFGFGLVEEPSLTTTDTIEDLPPLTDDTAIFSPEPALESSLPQDPAQTVPIQPGVERPAPVAPAEVGVTPTRDDHGLSPAPVAGGQALAGAASVSDASDASFLRRSVLVFLLAVVVVGLVLVWFRVQQNVPSGGETIVETSGESGVPPESVTPPPDALPSVSPPTTVEPSTSESSPGVAPSGETPPGAPNETPVTPTASEPEVASSPEPTAVSPSTLEQSSEAEPSAPVVATQDPAAIAKDVEQQVKSWADAWSKQQPEVYIECYAPDFSPADTSRREWERQRAARIRAPASILVQAKDISVTVLDGSRARATFYQDYETDTKHLYTWKTMELMRLPEGWRIVKERVGR